MGGVAVFKFGMSMLDESNRICREWKSFQFFFLSFEFFSLVSLSEHSKFNPLRKTFDFD